jgi:cation diffusion facilitator CzcD-associated flavoprotein CzcO
MCVHTSVYVYRSLVCLLTDWLPSNVVTPEKRQALAADPEEYLRFRKVIEDGGNVIHEGVIRGSDMQKELTRTFTASMRGKLAKKPELFEAIIPTFAPGCRRLTPGKGYLEALCQDNVQVTNETITEITETGVKLVSGREVHLDALACATGFRTSAPPNFEVVGSDGVTLAQRWAPHPESYLSVMVDGFPNYLMTFGPNSAIGEM